jgi:hypothetical protein
MSKFCLTMALKSFDCCWVLFFAGPSSSYRWHVQRLVASDKLGNGGYFGNEQRRRRAVGVTQLAHGLVQITHSRSAPGRPSCRRSAQPTSVRPSISLSSDPIKPPMNSAFQYSSVLSYKFFMSTAIELGPHTQTDRGTRSGVGL